MFTILPRRVKDSAAISIVALPLLGLWWLIGSCVADDPKPSPTSKPDKYAKEKADREARQAKKKADEKYAAENEAKMLAAANKKRDDAITKFIKENIGEPDTLQIVKITNIGKHHWLVEFFADDPNPPDNMLYDAVRVKFRAKNNFGSIQVFDKAVLLRGAKPVGMVRPGDEDLINAAQNDEIWRQFNEIGRGAKKK